MGSKPTISQIVWSIVTLVALSMVAMVIVLLFASSQVVVFTGFVTLLIVPTVTALLTIAKVQNVHEQTSKQLEESTQTLADKVANSP